MTKQQTTYKKPRRTISEVTPWDGQQKITGVEWGKKCVCVCVWGGGSYNYVVDQIFYKQSGGE